MKLEHLYCKEHLDNISRLIEEVESDRARMTSEAREAEYRENIASFNEIWDAYQSREVVYDEQAVKIYKQLIHSTEGIAHDFGIDLTAYWNYNIGYIELVFDMLVCESTANPLHLHLNLLLERCSSYSILPVCRYDQELISFTFEFSFTHRPFLDDLLETL